MNRRRKPSPAAPDHDVDAALAALSADVLRDVVRGLLQELDEPARSSAQSALIERAARGSSGWAPAALRNDEVEEALAFVGDAARAGQAEPAEIDAVLRRASNAFLGRDYSAAQRIFGALLPALGDAVIDLGHDETVDEVLGTDPAECAVQYVASVYLLARPAERAEAVLAAIEAVRSLERFEEPIRQMERAAAAPLPGLEDFLPRWRDLVAAKPADGKTNDENGTEARWHREIVLRLEGPSGLAKIARSTRRAADLRAWCKSLVEARDWTGALAAFDEASELVGDAKYVRGDLLDGAALAARELGRTDLPARLERAWRAEPSLLRLRRWLGSASSASHLRESAANALAACPKRAARQRAFLHLLLGELEPAAALLADAPGLGWSDAEHPGHFLFPRFEALLDRAQSSASESLEASATREGDRTERMRTTNAAEEARVAAPELDELLHRASSPGVATAAARYAMLAAMRTAAEKRVAGVTGNKRRGHYAHAAELVAACAACDDSAETVGWLVRLRDEHRRFPAFRAELDRALRP